MHIRAIFFGDSWTIGSNAKPREGGFAYLVANELGWTAQVLGGGGSGYTRPGPRSGDYFSRLSEMRSDSDIEIVVMQGSINDTRRCYMLPTKALRVLALARKKFPRARIVVMGPAPATPTVSLPLRFCDFVMAVAARMLRMPYVSPIRSGWITALNCSEIIDAEYHPSSAGHKYLASRLVPALRGLAVQPVSH